MLVPSKIVLSKSNNCQSLIIKRLKAYKHLGVENIPFATTSSDPVNVLGFDILKWYIFGVNFFIFKVNIWLGLSFSVNRTKIKALFFVLVPV